MANKWGIPKEVEVFVQKRDITCVYCKIEFSSIDRKSKQNWEHIINDIRLNNSENIALCCCSCNASKGNKKLSNPIGLITADEVIMAGGSWNSENSSYYL